jgi:hypothetical protein
VAQPGSAAQGEAAAQPGSAAQAEVAAESAPPAIDLRVGTSVGDCVLERVGPVHLGAVPIVLRDREDHRIQVDVLRRDRAGTQGIGNTAGLSLFLANQGRGDTPTRERHGLAVLALARLLGEREQEVLRLAGLLTLEQRLAQFPRDVYELC